MGAWEELETLISTISEMDAEHFKSVFLEWLGNNDDTTIECMSDVVDSLTKDITEEFSRCAEYNG